MLPVTRWVKRVVGLFSLDDAYYHEEVVDIPLEGVFTQSEISQLKVVLSGAIHSAEEDLDAMKKSLAVYVNAPVESDAVELDKKFYRKEIARLKKRIKLLANLSYKVKHKIVFANKE